MALHYHQPSPYDECPVAPVGGRPPRISGLAMPGGVHLATGTFGSAPCWQLFGAGVTLALLMALAHIPAYATAWMIEKTSGLPVAGVLLELPVRGDVLELAIAELLRNGLLLGAFLSVLWLSPLSGYHAAEHQTVACIERFGEVVPEYVAQMPRAHQRCGTNWLAGIIPLLVVGPALYRIGALVPLALVGLLGLHFRHYIGYFLQQHFTTRPPSERQLRAGIRAGQRLVMAWRAGPGRRVAPLRAIWNRGFAQVIAGAIIGGYIANLLVDQLLALLGS